MAFRLGCCGCMADGGSDGTGAHVLDQLSGLGYDYVELSLSHLARLTEPAFASLKRRLAASGTPCEACHNFFPAEIRLTGEAADHGRALDHADRALARAAELGAEVVVFGSSGAKNVPPGFPMARAWDQIVVLLAKLDPVARSHGIVIAIEPLNRKESNIVNSLAEGVRLTREVGGRNVRLLADYYHLMVESEPFSEIAAAGPYLRHVHFAELEGRTYPRVPRDEYARFFGALARAGYRGRVSVEAFTSDFAADAARASDVLRPLLAEAAGQGTA